MNYLSMVWLLIAFIFLILEVGHPGLFLYLSFFCGSLFAFSSSLLSYSLYAQLVFMVLGTLASLLILWLFLRTTKQLSNHTEPKTNMYALQGKRGYVLKDIADGAMGQIKIGSERWSATSVNNTIITTGSLVEVVQVIGCHCVVKEVT